MMKCDELKPLKNLEVAFNTTTEQEQVIAEDSEGNCYGFDSWEEVYLKDEVDAAIAELKAKLEDAKATAYTDSVDAGMRERRLRMALYKACANWADVEVFERTVGIDDPNVEANRWAVMRNKCLKKAEEYK